VVDAGATGVLEDDGEATDAAVTFAVLGGGVSVLLAGFDCVVLGEVVLEAVALGVFGNAADNAGAFSSEILRSLIWGVGAGCDSACDTGSEICAASREVDGAVA